MRKWTGSILAATLLLTACGASDERGGSRCFKSFEAEYYRVFYSMAVMEAIAPGASLDPAEVERIREKVRLASWRWASSVREELVLSGTRFTFGFSEFSDPEREVLLSDSVPVFKRRVYEGVFSRTGATLRFSVERADGVALPHTEVLEGVQTEGGGVTIGGWRAKGPFQGSVLVPCEAH